jgi:hypothetical protein
VKKGLAGALSRDLSDVGRRTFVEFVDQASEMISRMARRASMVLLYYVVRLSEEGRPLPDFDAAKDGFWKKWLRVGLVEFGGEMPTPDVQPYYDEVIQWVGSSVGMSRAPPEYFDRVLGHAAIGLKTAFMNNQTVNFFSKSKRLCRAFAKAHLGKMKGVGHELFEALRKDEVDAAWPSAAIGFVAEARRSLGLQPKVVLYEDTPIATGARMAYHWWMQQRFAELGQRKLMLSPVMQVSRMHIRLDATLLYHLAWKCFSPPPPAPLDGKPTKDSHPDAAQRKDAEKTWSDSRRMPTKTSHPVASERAAAKTIYLGMKAASAQREALVEDHKKAVAKFERRYGPSHGKLTADAPPDPRSQLAQELPTLAIGRRPSDLEDDDDAWSRLLEARRRARDERRVARDARQRSPEFLAAVVAYDDYEARTHRFAMLLFRPFDDKNPRNGWKPSSSVSTDGVSVSIAYERIERVPYAADDDAKSRRKVAKDAKTARADLAPHDAYDPEAPTLIADDCLILGIDPGRTHLVTVVCIDDDGKKHAWWLSRGQYYVDGGIRAENKRQAARYEPMAAAFASLTADGGSLRARRSEDLRSYFVAYAAVAPEWWALALKRREARAKMQRFIGKKAVLARFFSALRIDAEALMAKAGCKRIEVAYGSAGPNMAATGRGEAAVPTGGTYKACQEAFRRHTVSPTDESYTSAVSWNTGKAYETVYKRYDGPGNRERLCHKPGKGAPLVAEDAADAAATKDVGVLTAAAAKRRRGGSGDPRVASHAPSHADGGVERTRMKPRYPVCRGLLFCPERRMFYDRDEASAVAIAGLRRLELQGFGRPTAFRHKRKTTTIPSSSEGDGPMMDAALAMVEG